MVEVKLLRDANYGPPEVYHVGDTNKLAFCKETKVSSAWSAKAGKVPHCVECFRAATLPARKLVGLIGQTEGIIASLREDAGSLFTDSSISDAIGKLSQAARLLLDEAKDRALEEVKSK